MTAWQAAILCMELGWICPVLFAIFKVLHQMKLLMERQPPSGVQLTIKRQPEDKIR